MFSMLRAAAMLADVFVKIFLAVVVRELFARLDVAGGADFDALGVLNRLAVVADARMVDVPRDVFAASAVNRPILAQRKQIFTAFFIGLVVGQERACVFDDERTFFD